MLTIVTTPTLDVFAPDLHDQLDRLSQAELDAMEFGVVRMSTSGKVVAYNAYESRLAGLSRERVIGKHFFTEVAPCTNHYIVSVRFDAPINLDALVPYVFTLRMRPTHVQLRLLKKERSTYQYLIVARGQS